jgi:hypothetical protein
MTSSSQRAASPTAAHEPLQRTTPLPSLATNASSPPLVSSARMEAGDGADDAAMTTPREAQFVFYFAFFPFFKMQLHVI